MCGAMYNILSYLPENGPGCWDRRVRTPSNKRGNCRAYKNCFVVKHRYTRNKCHRGITSFARRLRTTQSQPRHDAKIPHQPILPCQLQNQVQNRPHKDRIHRKHEWRPIITQRRRQHGLASSCLPTQVGSFLFFASVATGLVVLSSSCIA